MAWKGFLEESKRLKRGRELDRAIRPEYERMKHSQPLADYYEDRLLALALLDRHLAQRVRELAIVPLDQCPECGALQDRGRVLADG